MAADQASRAHWHRAGLENSDNTCYSNAAIQFLLSAKPFISRYADDESEIVKDVRKESWNEMRMFKFEGDLYCKVSFNAIMVDLVRDITDERETVVSADNFKMIVSEGHHDFSNSDLQQDPFRYFLHLLSKIEKNIPREQRYWMDPCNCLRLELYDRIDRGKYNTSIKKRHEFAIRCPLIESREDTMSCASSMQDNNGSNSRTTVQRDNSLMSLGNAPAGYEQTRHIRLIDCIDKFMMKENTDSKQSEPVSKETKIAIPPEYLVIQPDIFDHRCQLQKTSDVHLDVPGILDIKKWISPDNWASYNQMDTAKRRKTRYELKAFVVHLEGSTSYTGHNVCYVKQDKIWSEYDDSKVRVVSEPPKTNGYVYMYERTNDAQQVPPPDYDEK